MSMFIGNSLQGKILHITKGSTELGDIKGSPIGTTIFHSNLNYVNIQHLYSSNIYIHEVHGNVKSTWFDVDQNTKNLMESYIWFIIASNGEVVKSALEVNMWQSEPTGAYPYTSGWVNGSLSYQIVRLLYDGSIRGKFYPDGIDSRYLGACSVCITNVTNTGQVLLPSPLETDILIKPNEVRIKGRDFLNFRFITPSITNSEDLVGTTSSGAFQILNSVPASGSLIFKSNSSETSIYKGSKPVISTNISKNMEIRYTGLFSPILKGYTNTTFGTTVLSFPAVLPANSIVFLTWTTNWGRSVCFIASPNGESNYLIGANLVYRGGVTGDADILRVKVIVYTTRVDLEVYYYKRVYSGSKGYYPNDYFSIPLNMSYLVLGN